MRRGNGGLVAGLAVAVVALGAFALVAALAGDDDDGSIAAGRATTLPTLRNYVGAPGSEAAEPPSSDELDAVRDQVVTWLVRNGFEGYRVAEVMAFVNNDYVAVKSSTGDDAFELLASPGAGWLMLEPPSLMWNNRYGMRSSWNTNWSGSGEMARLMGGGRAEGNWQDWYGEGGAKVSTDAEAVAVADAWLADRRPGETASGETRTFPGYYTIATVSGGAPAGMVSVNATTGEVWYHGWHGAYLSGQGYD